MNGNLIKAFFGNNEVNVSGGFQHPTKGHEVEIIGLDSNVPRQSISVWELNYRNIDDAREVFKKCFSCTPEQARNKDRAKGVIKTPEPIKIKKTAMLSY